MIEQVPDSLKPVGPRLILVVDDEPRMIRFIRMNLELEGYRVVEASNGIEALDQVRKHLPDLAVMDVMMPKMDGFEALRLLREISTVPVILPSKLLPDRSWTVSPEICFCSNFH